MDLNLRSLKRLNNGEYTLIPDSQRDIDRNLCGHCANKDCLVPGIYGQVEEFGATPATVLCTQYMPPIGFQSKHGLLKGKNTLRLGKAWASRVEKGDQMGLIDTNTKQMFGIATVSKSLAGSPDEILHNHSSKNHMFAGQRKTKAKACEEMTLLLPQIYGNMYWKAAKSISVIYFEEVKNICRIPHLKVR